jgi:hypothetical protein
MFEVIISGLCGAVGSVSGKIAFSSTPLVEYLIYHCEIGFPDLTNAHCVNLSYIFRLCCFGLMFYGNILMFSFFMKGLETRGSLPVTVVSSGTNFLTTGNSGTLLSSYTACYTAILFTGIVSGLVLGEKVNARWYAGAFIIAFGVCLIALSQYSKRTE